MKTKKKQKISREFTLIYHQTNFTYFAVVEIKYKMIMLKRSIKENKIDRKSF